MYTPSGYLILVIFKSGKSNGEIFVPARIHVTNPNEIIVLSQNDKHLYGFIRNIVSYETIIIITLKIGHLGSRHSVPFFCLPIRNSIRAETWQL